MVISGPEQLAAFRVHWDGKRMLDLLRQHNGRLRVDWAVGVGKSYNIDLTIEEAILSKQYDLVIALFPTRQIIEERRWVANPPKGIKLVNLQPRQGCRCGADMNRRWQVFEKNGLGALGRVELCGHCLLRPGCPWPRQFGKALKGCQVIFGAQAHLERFPYFLEQLAQWSEAERVLVILDEANFIMKPFQHRIDREQLRVFTEVLDKMNPKNFRKSHARWRYLCGLLLEAQTSDLRSHDWRFPKVVHDWSLAVQTRGYGMHGDAFFFLPLTWFISAALPLNRGSGHQTVTSSLPLCRAFPWILSSTAAPPAISSPSTGWAKSLPAPLKGIPLSIPRLPGSTLHPGWGREGTF